MAVFFTCIVLMLDRHDGVGNQIAHASMRKGFLPIATTRGDRLFIGLLSAAYVNLIWWAERKHGAVAQPGERAFGVDQLRLVDGVAGADSAKG